MWLESLENLRPVSHVGVVGMDYSWSFCRMRTCKKDCCCCCCCLVASVMHNSVRPYGLQPARLLCPWDSLGKSTRVGCHALLQGIFLTQGSNPGFLQCRQNLYCWATREAQGEAQNLHNSNISRADREGAKGETKECETKDREEKTQQK